MKDIRLLTLTGEFAENKDVARDIRLTQIIPALEKGDEVTLDFQGIDAVTQSFIHALISDLFRRYGNDILDRIAFKSCNETVQKVISMVVDYMQEAG